MVDFLRKRPEGLKHPTHIPEWSANLPRAGDDKGPAASDDLAVRATRNEGKSGAFSDAPPTSIATAIGVVADEVFRSLMGYWAERPNPRELRRYRREVAVAAALYEEKGWLSDPKSYHRKPPPPRHVAFRRTASLGRAFEHMTFPSEFEPLAEEPGRARWLSQRALREAHAWVLRHRHRERPWLVCLHGYRMGFPLADFHAFRVRWLHEELGLNVAVPVLPLHGPRRTGRRSGDRFFGPAILDTVHAVAQSAWDVRRLLGWIRQDAPTVGVYGLSLGGYVTALLAGLERRLACAATMMPTTCIAELMRLHGPRELTTAAATDWHAIEQVLRVVSPLSIRPLVARKRRFVVAATSDRLVPAGQVEALWKHWNEPRIYWFDGTHLSFSWQGRTVNSILASILAASGLIAAADTDRPSRASAR